MYIYAVNEIWRVCFYYKYVPKKCLHIFMQVVKHVLCLFE